MTPADLPDSTQAQTPEHAAHAAAQSGETALAGPELIPGYTTIRELGRGGMGIVYEAVQTKLGRTVALKTMLGDDVAGTLRFLAEAEAVASIDHPNVVRVYDFGQHGGRPYMAMEYLAGGSLADFLKANGGRKSHVAADPEHVRSGGLPPRDAVPLVSRIAAGVAAAHALGIVHRDLKPANVLLQGTRGEGHEAAETASISILPLSPKVTDFGLAKRGAART